MVQCTAHIFWIGLGLSTVSPGVPPCQPPVAAHGWARARCARGHPRGSVERHRARRRLRRPLRASPPRLLASSPPLLATSPPRLASSPPRHLASSPRFLTSRPRLPSSPPLRPRHLNSRRRPRRRLLDCDHHHCAPQHFTRCFSTPYPAWGVFLNT